MQFVALRSNVANGDAARRGDSPHPTPGQFSNVIGEVRHAAVGIVAAGTHRVEGNVGIGGGVAAHTPRKELRHVLPNTQPVRKRKVQATGRVGLRHCAGRIHPTVISACEQQGDDHRMVVGGGEGAGGVDKQRFVEVKVGGVGGHPQQITSCGGERIDAPWRIAVPRPVPQRDKGYHDVTNPAPSVSPLAWSITKKAPTAPRAA